MIEGRIKICQSSNYDHVTFASQSFSSKNKKLSIGLTEKGELVSFFFLRTENVAESKVEWHVKTCTILADKTP